MPELTRVNRPFQFAVLLDIGDDKNLGMAGQRKLGEEVALQWPKVPAERKVLLGCDVSIAYQQYAMFGECEFEVVDCLVIERPRDVDVRYFCRNGGGEAAYAHAHRTTPSSGSQSTKKSGHFTAVGGVGWPRRLAARFGTVLKDFVIRPKQNAISGPPRLPMREGHMRLRSSPIWIVQGPAERTSFAVI